jgi:adenylate cyclase
VNDTERPLPSIYPESRQRRLLAILRQAVQARSRREAAVMWLEDLHGLDEASAPYVEALAEVVAGTRTLLLATFRPEFHARWMQRAHYQQLPLLPLREDATAELLRELLGPDASVMALVPRIAERAAGNPFFAEELVQTLAEHGALAGERGAYRLVRPVDAVMMPPTVQAVLAARIDRLPEREKDVLQAAAVIGREFSEAVIRQVAAPAAGDLGSALANLTSAELVYEAAVFPEAVYAFKHPLTQEVAYASQLAERRRRVHAAVARAIEAADATKLDERSALVAHHWEAAGEPLAAATWHQRAAEWVGLRDRMETLRHWQKVRALTASLPESPETRALGVMACDAMLLHGLFAGQSDEEATALFAAGMELATRLDGAAPRIRLLLRLAVRKGLTGALDEVEAPLAEAWRLADETDDPVLQFLVRFSSTGQLISKGRLAEAARLIDELEERCGRDPEFAASFARFSPYAYVLGQRAGILVEKGRPIEALREAEHALEIVRARGDHEMILVASLFAVAACDFLGDAPGAMAHVREAAAAVEAGAEGVRQTFLLTLGRAHLLAREWRDAATALEHALQLTRERRTGLTIEGFILSFLAEALLGAGDLDGARERAEEAVAAARRRRTPTFEAAALLARARVAIAAGDASSAAERDLTDAMALINETGAHRFRPLIHVQRAQLARLRGDEPERERELREALRLFSEMGATARSAEVESELVS